MHTRENIFVCLLVSMPKMYTHLGECYFKYHIEIYYVFCYSEDQSIHTNGTIDQRFTHIFDVT